MSQGDDSNGAVTVVLVHGAFADASSWNGVIECLQAKGVKVTAAANPLRGVSSDSAYIAAVFEETQGPVVAVGHSYAGAVITNAAAQAKNVAGLVFVAGFAPEEGESLGEATAGSEESILGSTLVPHHYPSGNGGEAAVEFLVDPAKFHDVLAADLPAEQTALMAAAQRPVAELAFSEATTSTAWKDLSSWAVVATHDKAAGTDVIRSMAERAGATITEIEGSHSIMISQPQAVSEVILEAVAAVRPPS